MSMLKKYGKWIAAAVILIVVAAVFVQRYWQAQKTKLPEGIASGNGRVEAKQIDVASKLPLRVKEVLVQEGDVVKPGAVLVRMDTTTLEAELASANEQAAAAREQLAVAKAAVVKRRAEIELAKVEERRSSALVRERAGSQRENDVRATVVKTTSAGLGEDLARAQVADAQIKVAEANVATIKSRIDDATLTAPVLGRVLYRLAEPGEVLGVGGKALTLVNLEDVYMEIYLPSDVAAAVRIGSEARFTVDYSDRVGVGAVSFVSPEAQFTPKEVETRSEREKLMFRVKIQVPRELLAEYVARVKTGARGVGYVKVRDDATWPAFLNKNLVRPRKPEATR